MAAGAGLARQAAPAMALGARRRGLRERGSTPPGLLEDGNVRRPGPELRLEGKIPSNWRQYGMSVFSEPEHLESCQSKR